MSEQKKIINTEIAREDRVLPTLEEFVGESVLVVAVTTPFLVFVNVFFNNIL